MLNLALSLSMLISSALPGYASYSSSERKKNLSKAEILLRENRLVDAEKAYRTLLEEDENGDAYAGLAVSLAKQKNPKKVIEAEGILRECKDKFHENSNMKTAASLVALEHSKTVASSSKRDRYLGTAEAAFNQINSSRVKPIIDRAKEAIANKEWVKAAASLREAIRLAPELPEAHRLLGDVLDQLGDKEEAKKERDKANELTNKK